VNGSLPFRKEFLGLKSGMGHSRPSRNSSKPGHVCYAAASGSQFKALVALRPSMLLVGNALDMIQTPKPEPRIMRYELSDYEWTAIKPMLRNE
jgi:hypothetical protein